MSATDSHENRLLEWYSAYIGEPDRHVDVYLGFALFFGAIGLGLIALVAALIGGRQPGAVFLWRKVAFALGMASVPTALASVVVLLPVDRRGLFGAVAGGGLCLAAILWFSQVYPTAWAAGPGPQYSTQVILVYGLGVTTSLGATGAALVAYHVDRVRRPHPSEIEHPEDDKEETVSDEQIRRDIEQSMASVDIEWGGVERTENTPLELTDTGEIDASGAQIAVERVRTESNVDAQVDGLQSLKGTDRETHRSTTTVEEQTRQLQDLKRRRSEDDAPEETALLARLHGWIASRLG